MPVTAPARITQADMERATMAAAKAYKVYGAPTRVIMDFKNERIKTILGEPAESPASEPNEWDDE